MSYGNRYWQNSPVHTRNAIEKNQYRYLYRGARQTIDLISVVNYSGVVILYKCCSSGGAGCHGAPDLQSAKEAGGCGDSQETRGKSDARILKCATFTATTNHLLLFIRPRHVRPYGRMWRGKWSERKNCSSDTESCWWRERHWSATRLNIEQHRSQMCVLC